MKKTKYGRYGKFYVGDTLILDNTESVACVFAKMKLVVVRAEHLFHRSEIEYYAISPLFRMLELGEATPEYELTVHTDKNGNVDSVTVKEKP